MKQEKFDIYKASAGSGKTYNLVLKYLLLLFKEKYYNDYHKRILAVTFTNKATDEMKRRIIESLYKMTIKDSSYIELIMREYSDLYRSEEEVSKMAYKVLECVLNKYTNFNVRTIDSFFQQILRSFASDINYYSTFRVELDKNAIIESTIDDVLTNLEKQEPLYEYIEKFTLMKVKSGSSFNIKRAIFEMVINLYDDAFIKLSDELPTINELQGIVSKFENLEGNTLTQIEVVCNDIMQEMGGLGLEPTMFKLGKNSFAKYFQFDILEKSKFSPSNSFLKALLSSDIEDFAAKANKDIILPFVGRTTEKREVLNNLIYDYHTLMAIMKNLYIIVIVNELKDSILKKSKDENLLLISSSVEFINKIIQNSDTPFIYEKTGVFIDNYMIDEFQDTSILQWENFMPLLMDSVANGNWNMVVGDVKQSIYRWREGDWSILNSRVEGTVNNPRLNFLADNYRSYKNIVEMNNCLLPLVIDATKSYLEKEAYVGLQDGEANNRWSIFKDLYSDLKQNVKIDKEGSYNISFIQQTDKEKNWKKIAVSKMTDKIKELYDEKGYNYADITVLVRDKKEAKLVANYLMEKYIPVVSNEALFVNNSIVVKFVLAFMSYVSNPYNEQYRLDLAFIYAKISKSTDEIISDIDKYIVGDTFNIKEWEVALFGEKIALKLDELKLYSLYELSKGLISLFNLNGIQTQYTQALLDILFELENQGNGELIYFLDFWTKKGDGLKISMSNKSDSVGIYTIHKSKGMEYDIVFIPFCDWALKPNSFFNNYVWVSTQDVKENISNGLPIVPLDLGKGYSSILSTHFADKAREEFEKCCIDQLNITYVAFTRAVKHLFVYSKLSQSKDGSIKDEFTVPYLLYSSVKSKFSEHLILSEIDGFQIFDYCCGEINQNDTDDSKRENHQLLNVDNTIVDIKDKNHVGIEKYLRLKGDVDFDLIADEHMLYGKIMHGIFETLKSVENVDESIEKIVTSKVIDIESSEKIKFIIYNFINYNEEIRSWFAGGYKIYNEVELLMPDGDVYRPDRVMIDDLNSKAIVVDYKFGVEQNYYKRQVKKYMDILKEMGYLNVEGRICYISEDVKIVCVG